MWPNKVPENKPTPNPEVSGENGHVEQTPSEADKIAASLSGAMEKITAKLSEMDSRFAKLEEQTRKPEPKAPQPDAPTSVLDNEDLAFAQRMSPLLARTLEVESKVVRSEIKAEYVAAGYGDLWAKFGKEIDEILDKSPLINNQGQAHRGDPQYIRNVVDMIFGRAARSAGMRFDGKSKGFFLETATGGNEGTSGPVSDGLSEAQRKLLGKMGVPLDKAKDVIKNMTFVA